MVRRMSLSVKAGLAFAAVYVVWGSTYLAIRYALETIPPFTMMGVRSLVAGSILSLWSRLRGDEGAGREHLPALFIIGSSFFLVGHGLLAWAQQYVSSGLAAILVASEPLWVIAIETAFVKDARVGKKGVGGLLIGFFGLLYLILSTKGIDSSGTNWAASIAVVLGAISWSGGAVYSRIARLPKSPMLSAGLELLIGGSLLFAAAYLFGEWGEFQLSQVSLRSAAGLLYLIIFGSVVTFSAYIWLLGHTSATRVSTHTYVNPIIAVLLGWLMAGEALSLEVAAATVVIIGSVYLVLKDHSFKPTGESKDVVPQPTGPTATP